MLCCDVYFYADCCYAEKNRFLQHRSTFLSSGATAVRITASSIMTLSIRIKNMNLSINDHQHYETRHLVSLCCVVMSIFMLIVVMLKKQAFQHQSTFLSRGATAVRIMATSITTLSITIKNTTLTIYNHLHYVTQHLVSLCCVMLSIFMLKKQVFEAICLHSFIAAPQHSELWHSE
jgi:hypothetical protein